MSIKIAVDDGYGNMKVAFRNDKGDLVKVVVPSHITTRSVYELDKTKPSVRAMRTESGITYFVGARHETEDTRFSDFATHDINRLLVRYALSMAGLPDDAKYDLAVGLPVHQYYAGGAVNQEVIKRKMEHHNKPVFLVGEHNVDLPLSGPSSVRCYPQSSMVPMNYGEDGLDLENSTLVVVDIGYRTTDITYLEDGDLVSSKSGGKPDIGMAYAIDEFGKSITQRFGYQMPEAIINRIFERSKVMHNGEQYDVSEQRNAALDRMADVIIRSTEQIIGGSSAHVDRIVLIGGGASFLLDFLRKQGRWPHARLHSDPLFANALAWLNTWEHSR